MRFADRDLSAQKFAGRRKGDVIRGAAQSCQIDGELHGARISRASAPGGPGAEFRWYTCFEDRELHGETVLFQHSPAMGSPLEGIAGPGRPTPGGFDLRRGVIAAASQPEEVDQYEQEWIVHAASHSPVPRASPVRRSSSVR